MLKSMVGTPSLILLAALCGTIGRSEAGFTTNLLSNPGAEAGTIVGWTVGGTSNPNVENGSFDPGINPHTGNYDFYGGAGPSGSLTQTVSLVGNQGITAAQIDSGTLFANLSFFEQGLNQGAQSDDAFVSLTFLSTTSTVLGTFSSPEIDSHNLTWQGYSNLVGIMAGTRSISYTMNFVRYVGSDLDSFVDDNSLTVGTPSAVPEPSSLLLTGTATLSGVGFWVRKRRKSPIA